MNDFFLGSSEWAEKEKKWRRIEVMTAAGMDGWMDGRMDGWGLGVGEK